MQVLRKNCFYLKRFGDLRARSNQGIDRFQRLETPEIPVSAPQHRDAVFNAQCSNACIVKLATLQFALAG